MLISCPYCGPRDVVEFTYQGDANRRRPDPGSTDQEAWNAFVYERVNTLGDHDEYWQHSGGCRMHMKVRRSTATHQITSVELLRTHGSPAPSASRRKPGARA